MSEWSHGRPDPAVPPAPGVGGDDPTGIADESLRLLLEDSAEDLYENAPCGYLSVLMDGTVVKANGTFLSWTGRTSSEVVGRVRFPDLLTVGGRIFWETHLGPLLLMQDHVREIALDLRRPGADPLPVLVNARVRRDSVGSPVVVRVMLLDATERTAYERELLRARRAAEQSEERVRALHRVTAELSVAGGTREVADAVAQAGVTVFGAAAAAVWLRHAETGELVPAASATSPPSGAGLVPAPEQPAAGSSRAARLLAEALHAGEPVFAAPGRLTAASVIEAVLPLPGEPAAIGVLHLRFTPARQVPPAERAALVAVAGQSALALSRARLHEQTAIAAGRSAFLARLGRELDEDQTVAGRAERLAELAVSEVADTAAVLLPRRDGGWEAAAVRVQVPRPAPETGDVPAQWAAAAARARATDSPQSLAAAAGDVPADGLGGGVALPLRARGQGLGALVLLRNGAAFWSSEVPFLMDVADRGGLALENARLYEQEHDVAHTLQRSLLPDALPTDRRVGLAPHYRPAVTTLEVGGDWYDAFAVRPGVLAVAVGDVVGRGVTAASAMGQLRSAIRAVAVDGPGPAGLLERLDVFVESVESAQMATLAYLELELATGRVRYACAGHLPPLLTTAAGASSLVWGGRSTPLGARAGTGRRGEAELHLTPGSQLLLYTDGLVERRRRSLTDGLDLLTRRVEARRGQPLGDLVRELTDEMLEDADSADDVCLLALRYRGLPELDLELPPRLDRLRGLRADLREWLAALGVGGDDVDALVLATSEAAANGVEHGCRGLDDGGVRVTGRAVGDRVEVRVADPGGWSAAAGAEPEPEPPRGLGVATGTATDPGERGRGLFLMRRLVDRVEVWQAGELAQGGQVAQEGQVALEDQDAQGVRGEGTVVVLSRRVRAWWAS